MGLLNKQYRPYILMTIAGVMFAICLFVFKPVIKMAELYTLFARVQPDTLKPILDFGAEHFVLSNVVPAIPSLELANLPLIADIGLCGLIVFLTTFVSIVIPNIFIDFSLGLIMIFGYCLFCVTTSRFAHIWIPIVWPVLIQTFVLSILTTAKTAMKQTKLINNVKLFGYDINKFPNSIPFIKNIIQQPKRTDITLCCFKLRVAQLYLDDTSAKEIVSKINEVFKIIVDGVLKHDGILDKTSNNTIIAYWLGENNAINAIKAVNEINSLVKSDNIKISCGMDTEYSIFAILGSENFANYTVLGNISDIAARLENACIFHSTKLLISENTINCVQNKVTAKRKGSISVHSVNPQLNFYEFEGFVEND
mgnify:FL=1